MGRVGEAKEGKGVHTVNRQVTYFTDEGGFGSAKGLIRIDTTKWSSDDWTKIISAEASVRKIIAMQIEHIHKERESK